MAQIEIFRTLSACRLFSGVDIAILSRTARDAEVVNYASGAVIDRLDTPGIAVLCSGNAVATASATSENTPRKTLRLTRISTGEAVGFPSLFSDGAFRPESVVTADGDCVAAFIPEASVRVLISESPRFAENLVAVLCGKLRLLTGKVSSLGAEDVSAKLLAHLRRNTEERNMSRLAATLGVGRTSLYRAIAELESDGRVKRDGKRIIPIT